MLTGIILGIFLVLGASWYVNNNNNVVVIERSAQVGQVTQSWENLENKGD